MVSVRSPYTPTISVGGANSVWGAVLPISLLFLDFSLNNFNAEESTDYKITEIQQAYSLVDWCV